MTPQGPRHISVEYTDRMLGPTIFTAILVWDWVDDRWSSLQNVVPILVRISLELDCTGAHGNLLSRILLYR